MGTLANASAMTRLMLKEIEERERWNDPNDWIDMNDRVNSPTHYTSGGIEAIDYIKAKLGDDGCIAYCLGNVIKYVSRAGKKDIQKELEDLKKAQWYLNKAVSISTTDNDYYVS